MVGGNGLLTCRLVDEGRSLCKLWCSHRILGEMVSVGYKSLSIVTMLPIIRCWERVKVGSCAEWGVSECEPSVDSRQPSWTMLPRSPVDIHRPGKPQHRQAPPSNLPIPPAPTPQRRSRQTNPILDNAESSQRSQP